MPVSTDRLGRFGERVAERYLQKKGMKILARNWRVRAGELDLVLRRGRTLVFVEVKTRRWPTRFAPEVAVDGKKQRRLRRAGRAWLRRHPFRFWSEIRFDVVAVTVDHSDEVVEVKHFEDAF